MKKARENVEYARIAMQKRKQIFKVYGAYQNYDWNSFLPYSFLSSFLLTLFLAIILERRKKVQNLMKRETCPGNGNTKNNQGDFFCPVRKMYKKNRNFSRRESE